jgi:hypothetical protein
LFIAWSGIQSKTVALALRDRLPVVLQYARPWVSETDIEAGAPSHAEIAKGLEGCKVGIICLTIHNLHSTWLAYEAGALSKTVGDKAFVCPYLIGALATTEVTGPLSMFQAIERIVTEPATCSNA